MINSIMLTKRNTTPSQHIAYALQLYFSGLSLRKTSQQLLSLFIKRDLFQYGNRFKIIHQRNISKEKKKVQEFIVDET